MNRQLSLLKVKNLSVQFRLGDEYATALRDVSFEVHAGETLGLAGESGCGKSTAALAIMNLLPDNGRIAGGEVWFQGKNLTQLPLKELRKYWWKDLSIVFQGALNSLNPVKTVGAQIAEAMIVRNGMDKMQAWDRVKDLFRQIGIRPERISEYPHEFSGGMRQRVMIAMAICLNPKLVIADECTTALDVMIQTQIMNLLKELKSSLELSMLFINHDLALIAEICDRVAIMYAGRIVEIGPVRSVFFEPIHPYVKQLLNALPRMEDSIGRLHAIPGTPPRLQEIPEGCPFLPRCHQGDRRCGLEAPLMAEVYPDHWANCHKINPPGRK